MQKNRNSHHVYDYIVIGAGLTGLCVATALNRLTTNILLIDANDNFGGMNRSVQTPLGPMNNGLRFLPDSALSHKAISFLEMLLMTQLNPVVFDQPPVTFESGSIKPFVGFGESSPEYYDDLFYYCAPRQMRTLLEPHEWTQLLFSNYTGDFLPRSVLTKINAQDENIQSILINGQKQLQAHNFVYCGPVKGLKTLLTDALLPAKAKAKLSKGPYWTALCLDILHSSKVTDTTAIHVLNSTVPDEVGPCIGQFHSGTSLDEQAVQYSQWVSFIDDESAENEETIGTALKKIKRQIKRVYPNALEQTKFERIMVSPGFSGHGDLKLTSHMTLPALKNFWISSAQVNPTKNLLGSLLQAEMVSSSLGAHPMGVAVQMQGSALDAAPPT